MDGSGAGVREAALGPGGGPARYGLTLPTLTRDQFDLGEMFRMLRRRRGIILGSIAAVTLAAILVVFTLTPRYTAETALLLDTRKTQIIDMQAVMSSIQTEAAALRSEIDVLRSRELAGKVIDKLGLMGDPNFNEELKEPTGLAALIPAQVGSTVSAWLASVGIGPDAERAELTEEQRREVTRGKLIDKLLDNIVVANDIRSFTI
jgi:uncharacterized protein involved in exopolysaccharide biosynthesis